MTDHTAPLPADLQLIIAKIITPSAWREPDTRARGHNRKHALKVAGQVITAMQTCKGTQPDPRETEIERLRETLAEAEADAARYQWLRDNSCPPHNFYISVPDEFHDIRYSPQDVDAYIDEARAALAKSDVPEIAHLMHAQIDYGCGKADLFGTFTEETARRQFYHFANQCFGIRKSISDFKLLSIAPASLPSPWDKLEGAVTVLMHSGDTIVWNADGEKIKSEWD